MATSKLLKPTNVTISIPEFTDQPDQRVNSNCIDKLADAVNSNSDHIETINTKNSSSWFNSSYVSSGGATLIQIGDLCIVQLYDIKFSQDISNSQASNAITLVTLPYAENSGGQVFLLNRANDNAQTIRLQVAGSIIRPWWSSIPKTSSGEGWFGIVMFKKS